MLSVQSVVKESASANILSCLMQTFCQVSAYTVCNRRLYAGVVYVPTVIVHAAGAYLDDVGVF